MLSSAKRTRKISELAGVIGKAINFSEYEFIKRDIIQHAILYRIYKSDIRNDLLFKGGTCIIKCYVFYHRFSADLDFTWRHQKVFDNMSRKKIRKEILDNIFPRIKAVLKSINNYGIHISQLNFARTSRMITVFMGYDREEIKIQINFTEKLEYPPRRVLAKPIITPDELGKEYQEFYDDVFEFYKPVEVLAYDPKEIGTEKIRAILTRRGLKIYDLLDLFFLETTDLVQFNSKLIEKSIQKTIFSIKERKKYCENLKRWMPINLDDIERHLQEEMEHLLKDIDDQKFREFVKNLNQILKKVKKEALEKQKTM